MLCPRRYAATENSTGIVGAAPGAGAVSNTRRPRVKTSSTSWGFTIRGRKSVRIIHW